MFCLDCANKNTEAYNALDLCSAQECISARVTNRQDLEGAHEPSHKLVKVRTAVLKRQHGRAHTAAEKAFERVEPFCRKISEISQFPETERAAVNGKSAHGSKSLKDTTQEPSPQIRGKLPVCGNCEGALSFPFWYCIFCEGQPRRLQILLDC